MKKLSSEVEKRFKDAELVEVVHKARKRSDILLEEQGGKQHPMGGGRWSK